MKRARDVHCQKRVRVMKNGVIYGAGHLGRIWATQFQGRDGFAAMDDRSSLMVAHDDDAGQRRNDAECRDLQLADCVDLASDEQGEDEDAAAQLRPREPWL